MVSAKCILLWNKTCIMLNPMSRIPCVLQTFAPISGQSLTNMRAWANEWRVKGTCLDHRRKPFSTTGLLHRHCLGLKQWLNKNDDHDQKRKKTQIFHLILSPILVLKIKVRWAAGRVQIQKYAASSRKKEKIRQRKKGGRKKIYHLKLKTFLKKLLMLQ